MINFTSVEELKELVVKLLIEKKAENISVIDVSDKTTLTTYMILSDGRSNKNIMAIADFISLELKKHLGLKIKIDGFNNAQWIVLDIGDIIVHIFNPETRQYYQLEQLWN